MNSEIYSRVNREQNCHESAEVFLEKEIILDITNLVFEKG